jgi:hypothetical protein
MRAGDESDRFASWPRGAARLALVAVLALLILAALVPISRNRGRELHPPLVPGAAAAERPRDDDLQVYDNVIVRLQAGQGYYAAVAAEHRAIGFPLKPGLAVRLPTLAWIEAAIGPAGEHVAAVLLLAAVLAAWWRRLGSEPGAKERRLLAIALLAVGAVLMLNVYFYRLHELWAGMLLALSFGLHRPGKWGWALAAAALALAIRELALPYVVLMAALALWRGDRREGLAWLGLTAVFALALATHLHFVGAQMRSSDMISQSWWAFRGLSGALENAVFSSNLRYLPHWLAGPLVMLMMFGWAGWRSPAGTFGALLFAGYGLSFAIAGRDENYYWGMLITPCLAMGLAFLPGAARSLLRAAR